MKAERRDAAHAKAQVHHGMLPHVEVLIRELAVDVKLSVVCISRMQVQLDDYPNERERRDEYRLRSAQRREQCRYTSRQILRSIKRSTHATVRSTRLLALGIALT